MMKSRGTVLSCVAPVFLLLLQVHGQSEASNEMSEESSTTEYTFECHCNTNDPDCVNGTCGMDLGECAFRIRRLKANKTVVRFQQYCVTHLTPCIPGFVQDGTPYEIGTACCRGDFCNACPDLDVLDTTEAQLKALDSIPACVYNTTTDDITNTEYVPTPHIWKIAVGTLSATLFLLMGVAFGVCYCIILKRCRRCKTVDVESIRISPSLDDSYGCGLSGSGSSGVLRGNRMLQQRTMARMMKIEEQIARGGFGHVWRGEWDGNKYAVKIFPQKLYDSWEREGYIYKTYMLAHPNILQFMCMDKKDTNYDMELWLIFSYHHNGSLSSYLAKNTPTKQQALNFLVSIATGLNYLHLSIHTSTSDKKSIIAHRDLKSSNILIKDDMSCCIGDLGLAVIETDFGKGKSLPDPSQGTKRYMAPEILGGTIQKTSIHGYVMADVYTFALIIWEVSTCCQWNDKGEAPPYTIPYQNLVPNDPSFDDMKKVVVTERVRPPLDPNWKNDEVFGVISKMLSECWRANPNSRLSTMRMRKNLKTISMNLKQNFN